MLSLSLPVCSQTMYVFFMCFNLLNPWAGLRLPESGEIIWNVKIDSNAGVFLCSERAVKGPVVASICIGLSQFSSFCSFFFYMEPCYCRPNKHTHNFTVVRYCARHPMASLCMCELSSAKHHTLFCCCCLSCVQCGLLF